jgi:tetratricopeptide (TPR) repeat protein
MLIHAGKADAAVTVLGRAVREYPTCIPAAGNLALALRDVGRARDGMEVLRNQIARGRESSFSWQVLAELSIATGDASGGHAALERALALAPRDATLAVDGSSWLMRTGRFDLAAAILRTAIAGGADSAPVRLNLAASLINTDRWADAREHFARALELEPAMPEAHEQATRYLLESHDRPGWRAELERWAKLGTDAGRWRAAAEAALKPADAPDVELAVRAARRAVELLPADGGLQALLSDALAAAGEQGPAAAAADEALQRLGEGAPPELRARLEARSRQR